MPDVAIALLGALIGAAAGLGGGAVAALASLRASQIAARAPLAAKIHVTSKRIVKLRTAIGTPDYDEHRVAFEEAWNDLASHQKILCPSTRIEDVLSLLREVARHDPSDEEEANAEVALAGEALGRVADMIAAHSKHLLRVVAIHEERRILSSWVDDESSEQSSLFRDTLRKIRDGRDRESAQGRP